MSVFELNINNNVTVVLTPFGVRCLYEHYRLLRVEELIKYCHETDNVYKFQMWELMNIFGKYMYNGATLCFEDNKITLNVKK